MVNDWTWTEVVSIWKLSLILFLFLDGYVEPWTAVTLGVQTSRHLQDPLCSLLWKLLENVFFFFLIPLKVLSPLTGSPSSWVWCEGVQLIPLGNTLGPPHDNFNLLLLSSLTPWLLGHNFFISQGHKLYKCPLRKESIARVCGRQFFPQAGSGEDFRMIQANYIYCALYFHFYYISSTSDDQH